MELSNLHMYKFYYDVLKPLLEDIKLHYVDTDSFILSYSRGYVDNKHMDLSNLDIPIKSNDKVHGKFKHELGSKIIEKIIVLKPKTYSKKNYGAKEKGIKKESNGKHEEYYNALIENKERTVEESRIQKVGSCMTTIKISKRSLNNFDDKRFYVNNIKSYPLDENMYLFKTDLLNKILERNSSVVIQQISSVASQAGPLINNTTLDVSKESLEALINNIKELTIKEDKKFSEAAIRLYNDLIKND